MASPIERPGESRPVVDEPGEAVAAGAAGGVLDAADVAVAIDTSRLLPG
jgi:hypothetical protein